MGPSERTRSRLTTLLAVVMAAIGLVGYVVFGWRFDGSSGPIVTAIALVAVAVAIASTLLRS